MLMLTTRGTSAQNRRLPRHASRHTPDDEGGGEAADAAAEGAAGPSS